MIGDNARQRLRSFVDRIERLDEEIKDLNGDKSDVFKEAKATGFDVKALRQVIKLRRMDASDRAELEDLVSVYMGALEETGTSLATRARTEQAPHDPKTGEIIATESATGPAPTPAVVAPAHTPQDAQESRDSASPDTPTHPNDIIPDIPAWARRSA